MALEDGWWKPLRKACSRMKDGDFDVVLASGPPHKVFVHA